MDLILSDFNGDCTHAIETFFTDSGRTGNSPYPAMPRIKYHRQFGYISADRQPDQCFGDAGEQLGIHIK